MKPFELYITYISWERDGKYRPVVVLNTDEEVSLYPITTRYEQKSETIKKQYYKIEEWSKAGLSRQSYIDTGTLLYLAKSTIEDKKYIGNLSSKDKVRLLEFLQNRKS